MNNKKRVGGEHEMKCRGVWAGSRILCSEEGMVLVLVLILSVISLAFMAGLLYMATSATQMSGASRRYETALQAGKAGENVVHHIIETRGNPTITNLAGFGIPATNVSGTDCLNNKLNNPTASWNVNCNQSLAITPGTPTTYDMTFTLGTAPDPVYTVYAKIVDTVNGNSGPNSGILKTGVVSSVPGEVTVMSVPFLYTVEILVQNAANPLERARLAMLQQF